MKKIIAMLLVLVMSVTGLVGCGSSNKSGSEAGSTSTSSDSDWAYIQGKGKLTVGITLFAPMNYYNEKNELVGFDTEMAQAVAKKLGIDVEFSEINWDSKEVELNSKNIDCLWNGMCITEERKQNMSVSDSDWAYIQGKGKLTVGITLFAPMNYYNEKNELVGFDTEMAQAVAKKLGIDVEFSEINWDSKEVELNSKNIDCLWNGMCITEERKQNMSVSDPYLYNTQAMVMKKSREKEIMKSVKGLTVTAEQGSTGEGKIDGSIADDDTVKVSAKDYFKDANYVASDSMAKALMEVKSGTADVALVDSVCALGMVGEGTDYEDLVINMDNNFGQQEYGIAFRKGSDVTEKVNQAIKELYEDGTVDTIAKKYDLQDMLIK